MSHIPAIHDPGGPQSGSLGDALYKELWSPYTGPLFNFACEGECASLKGTWSSFLKKVEAFTPHEKKLPYMYSRDKILCKVVNVLLQQNEVTIPDLALQEPPSCIVHSTCNTLTELDITTQQGASLPYRHAADCFPPLDTSLKPPSQELVAWDIHGNEWHFCHILQGQPERHFLTAGWSEFIGAKIVASW